MNRRSEISRPKGAGVPSDHDIRAKRRQKSLIPDELRDPDQPKGVWCITAVVAGEPGSTKGNFDVGATVYCLPPMRGGAFESVDVFGLHRKSGKLVSAVVAVNDLDGWKAATVSEPELREKISPPWDSSHVSQGVAEGIVAWKAGGAWPVGELRVWNRSRAQKVVGEGSLLTRLKHKIFGRE
jgi:hypothetical protein